MPAVLLFDEDCRLCRALVRHAARRADPHVLRFAALASSPGRDILRSLGLPDDPDSMVLRLGDGSHRLRSDAALEAARLLGYPAPLVAVARAVPCSWRDAAYAFVARVRRRIPLPDRPIDRAARPDVFLDAPAVTSRGRDAGAA